jgi:Fe-S cluster biogenesis protein NfuA
MRGSGTRRPPAHSSTATIDGEDQRWSTGTFLGMVEFGQILGSPGVDPTVTPLDSAAPQPQTDFEVIGSHPDRARRLSDLADIIEVIRPVIAADGGELQVISVDVEEGVVTLQLAGACGSCAVSGATLNQGIDRILRDRLDWVTAIVGQIEESDTSGYGGWTPKTS